VVETNKQQGDKTMRNYVISFYATQVTAKIQMETIKAFCFESAERQLMAKYPEAKIVNHFAYRAE
jgi:hypothetical protein